MLTGSSELHVQTHIQYALRDLFQRLIGPIVAHAVTLSICTAYVAISSVGVVYRNVSISAGLGKSRTNTERRGKAAHARPTLAEYFTKYKTNGKENIDLGIYLKVHYSIRLSMFAHCY